MGNAGICSQPFLSSCTSYSFIKNIQHSSGRLPGTWCTESAFDVPSSSSRGKNRDVAHIAPRTPSLCGGATLAEPAGMGRSRGDSRRGGRPNRRGQSQRRCALRSDRPRHPPTLVVPRSLRFSTWKLYHLPLGGLTLPASHSRADERGSHDSDLSALCRHHPENGYLIPLSRRTGDMVRQ